MSVPDKTVLLFGMPRSGTTWIGKIFDSDPNTLYVHEPDSWQRMDFLPLFIEGEIGSAEIGKVHHYHSGLSSVRTSQVTTKLPVFRKNYQTVGEYYQYKLSIYIINLLQKLNSGLHPLPTTRMGKSASSFILVWKSIESLGRLSSLSSSIENAFGIHIVRNPAGYIASVLNGEKNNNFRGTTSSSADYSLLEMLLSTKTGRELGIDVSELKSMEPVERLAIRWRLYNEIAYNTCKEMNNYYLLRYEDLCKDPSTVVRKLFSLCGMDWNEQTERFIYASTHRQNDAYYALYKEPVKSANRWRENLDRLNIDRIKHVLSGSLAYSWYQDDFSSSES